MNLCGISGKESRPHAKNAAARMPCSDSDNFESSILFYFESCLSQVVHANNGFCHIPIDFKNGVVTYFGVAANRICALHLQRRLANNDHRCRHRRTGQLVAASAQLDQPNREPTELESALPDRLGDIRHTPHGLSTRTPAGQHR